MIKVGVFELILSLLADSKDVMDKTTKKSFGSIFNKDEVIMTQMMLNVTQELNF
jgi:hypothetical protein